IEQRSDDELAQLMNNLGGHDLPSVVEAFDRINHDRPTCFIAYTVKGFGLPIAGHKDNHAGLMTPAQMDTFRDRVPFASGGPRRLTAQPVAVPDELAVTIQPEMSTQFGFGAILNEIARQ